MGKQRTQLFWTDLARHIRNVVLVTAIMAGPAYAQGTTTPREFDVPAGRLDAAVERLGEQAGLQIVYDQTLVLGKTAGAVKGRLTAAEALKQMLSGTGLTWERINEQSIVLRRAPATPKPAVKPRSAQTASEGRITELPEILVTGTSTLNMDIERTRDDPQPYVVFQRETIERSGAVNLDDFFRDRLTMNTRADVNGQGAGFPQSVSNINLRGLGTDETLILVDGRRLPNAAIRGDPIQPDVNGIPLAAIERIEVLPTTAGGIYGGSATGGVVNIVLRRDYSGVEAKLTYDNTFDSDSALRRIDLSAGFPLEGGRTQLLISGSYTDQNDLLVSDRDFVQRGRRRILENNPGFFLGSSPPFGSTTNIASADGSNLTLKSGTALNSPITYVPPGYSGAASDGGAAFLANAGQYNLGISNNLGATSRGWGGRGGLLAPPTVKSLTASIRREFTANLEIFLEMSATDNKGSKPASNIGTAGFTIPESAPNNPFAQDIFVRAPVDLPFEAVTTNLARRAAAGFILKLPHNWSAAADYTWNQTKASESFHLFGDPPALTAAIADGRLDLLRDTNAFPVDIAPYGPFLTGRSLMPYRTTLKDATLRFAGPVGRLPAGAPILSVSIEHREEDIADAVAAFNPDLFFPDQSQDVDSLYAELRTPLLKTLELQIAARHDEYVTEGAGFTFSPTEVPARSTNKTSSTNPTIALRYQPLPDIALRASYGTGFLPPAVTQLAPGAPFTGDQGATDPKRGNEQIIATGIFGGRPDLRPEQSESWSIGVILTPKFAPGLRASLDYSRIDKTDNIAEFPGGLPALLSSEGLFPGRIQRADPEPGDPFGVGRITLVDMTLFNIARTKVVAWDLQLDYQKEMAGFGTFDFFVLGTWQPHFTTQNLASEPYVENVGNGIGNPVEYKANAGVTWNRRNWTLGWTTRYFGPYFVNRDNPEAILNQGNGGRIGSQIYHNASVEYRFGAGAPLALNSTTIQFGIRNIFNTQPPFDAGQSGLFYSFFGDPRLASYYLTVRHAF